MERFGVDWVKDRRLLPLFQGDIIHPRNRVTRPCRWAELGEASTEKREWAGRASEPHLEENPCSYILCQ